MPRVSNKVSRVSPRPTRIIGPKDKPFYIRLGGEHQAAEDGFQRKDGYLRLAETKTDLVDYVVDLKTLPWPIDDGLVDRAISFNRLMRLEMPDRIAFMNECWRVLKVGGQLIIVEPNCFALRAYSDPRAIWPPISPLFFYYCNKEWRENDKSDDLGITCDFDWGYGWGLDQEISVRNQDYQNHAIKYWINAAQDVHITLTKKP